MLGEARSHGGGCGNGGVLKGRDVGKWRRGWRSQQVVEYPFAAQDRRGSGGVGGHREHAALTEQAAAPRPSGKDTQRNLLP